MSIHFREIEIFKPYVNEFPEHLLTEAGAGDEVVERWQEAELLRIAKHGERILGMYAMYRVDSQNFHLLGVVVDFPQRHQGLGRWLTGHAIGVAESKGGRHLYLPPTGSSRCFSHMGFQRRGDGFYFDMIQE